MMTLIPYDYRKLNLDYKATSNYQLLLDFQESGLTCAKVEGVDSKKATSKAGSLNKSIEHFNFNNYKAISRKGELFLVDTSKIEKL